MFMLLLKLLWLAILTIILPLIAGGCLRLSQSSYNRIESLLERFYAGEMLLFAGFLLLSVPMILLERSFTELKIAYSGYAVVLVGIALARYLRDRRRRAPAAQVEEAVAAPTANTQISWYIAGALLLLQLVMALLLTYQDGDDAYYVAVSTMTTNNDEMYKELAYTGETMTLDVRHALAPFPVWISYLAAMSGISTVIVARTLLQLILIPQTYGIFYLMGSRLLAGKRQQLPLFLLFTEVLVLFGDYSYYSMENFMLARSRQGKAALGSILLPLLLYLLLLLVTECKEQRKPSGGLWLFLVCVMCACCLCSTMGAMLACLLVAAVGLCTAVCYRRPLILLPMAACCTPCVVFAALYLILG